MKQEEPLPPTIDELNLLFLDYQDDLEVRDRKLKLPIDFQEFQSLDGVLDLLKDVTISLAEDP